MSYLIRMPSAEVVESSDKSILSRWFVRASLQRLYSEYSEKLLD